MSKPKLKPLQIASLIVMGIISVATCGFVALVYIILDKGLVSRIVGVVEIAVLLLLTYWAMEQTWRAK